jgi:hypothetical protein
MNKYILLFIITVILLILYSLVRPDCSERLIEQDNTIGKLKRDALYNIY